MRPFLAIFATAMLFSAIFAAFSPADYLYPGENASSIDSSPVSASGAAYTLVKIGGHESFLLKDGTPLNSTAAILSALREGVLADTNFNERKAAIIDGIQKFNASRNKKIYPYSRYGVEDQCKVENVQVPCTTLSECISTATIVCSIDPTVSCDAGILGRAIYEFYPPSIQLTRDVAAALDDANTMTLANARAKLDDMAQKLPTIRSNAERMSHSIIRYPAISVAGQLWYPQDSCNSNSYANSHRDECGNVIGRCYPVPFDFASLSSAEDAANSLSDSISESTELEAISQQIAASTNDRIDFKVNSAIIAQYNAKFSAMRGKYIAIISEVERLQPLVSDPAFQAAASRLSSSGQSIELSISSKQYSGIDAKIQEYGNLALAANATLEGLSDKYGAAVLAQDAASDSLIEASWAINTKDSGVSADLGKLVERQSALDASFRPPLNSTQYIALAAGYGALSRDAKSFTGNRARNLLFSISGSAGKAGADSLLALASAIRPLEYEERAKLAPMMPTWLLVLTGLSIVSVAMVAFAAALIVFRGVFRQRLMMVVWVVALLAFFAVVGAGSAGAYVMLNQSSPGATLGEFMSEVQSQGSAYIIVDTDGATQASASSMESCASRMAKSLREDNIAVSTYKVDGSSCFEEGKPVEGGEKGCLDSMSASGKPIFHLKYSSEPRSPLFTLLVSKEALVSGDAAYMDSCLMQDAITNT